MGIIEETAAAIRDRDDDRYELTEAGEAALAAAPPRPGPRRVPPAGVELSPEERPTARLLALGGAALSDAELISILLHTGSRTTQALDLARGVLRDCAGLAGLPALDPASLQRAGIGPGRSACILAAVELAVRLARAELPDKLPLHRPAAAVRYLVLRYGRADQEVMGALYLDGRHRLLCDAELYRGTINRASVEPRAILRRALQIHASGVLLFHTHPSGDPAPSAEDLAFTRRLAKAGEIVGVELVDHLILGTTERFVSLRERGAW